MKMRNFTLKTGFKSAAFALLLTSGGISAQEAKVAQQEEMAPPITITKLKTHGTISRVTETLNKALKEAKISRKGATFYGWLEPWTYLIIKDGNAHLFAFQELAGFKHFVKKFPGDHFRQNICHVILNNSYEKKQDFTYMGFYYSKDGECTFAMNDYIKSYHDLQDNVIVKNLFQSAKGLPLEIALVHTELAQNIALPSTINYNFTAPSKISKQFSLLNERITIAHHRKGNWAISGYVKTVSKGRRPTKCTITGPVGNNSFPSTDWVTPEIVAWCKSQAEQWNAANPKEAGSFDEPPPSPPGPPPLYSVAFPPTDDAESP